MHPTGGGGNRDEGGGSRSGTTSGSKPCDKDVLLDLHDVLSLRSLAVGVQQRPACLVAPSLSGWGVRCAPPIQWPYSGSTPTRSTTSTTNGLRPTPMHAAPHRNVGERLHSYNRDITTTTTTTTTPTSRVSDFHPRPTHTSSTSHRGDLTNNWGRTRGQGRRRLSPEHSQRTLPTLSHAVIIALLSLVSVVPYCNACYVYPPDVKDPCRDKECSFGAHCVPSLDGMTARCQCPQQCHRYGDHNGSLPVCGSDGMDYENECEMRKASCVNMRNVAVKYTGQCDPCEAMRCQDNEVCQLDEHRRPVCRCNSHCSEAYSPVCGSNGLTYSNMCFLRVDACRTREDIRFLFAGDCESGNNPCSTFPCPEGQKCHVDRHAKPRCQCPPPCESVIHPVCGSNGVTYDNHCELRRQACQHNLQVTKAHDGECNMSGPCYNFRCQNGATCVVHGGSPMCQCPLCTDEYQPVCGSDGITYQNNCKLKRQNCEHQAEIQLAYAGMCDGCENRRCDHYAQCETDGRGGAHCVCPQVCPQVLDEVCGSDGMTYTNECHLTVTSCQQQKLITVASSGPCDPCANVKCRFGGICERGHCVCPQFCAQVIDPVCASDSQTYSNTCEMHRQACALTVDIRVVHRGECDQDSMEDGSGSGDVCDEDSCSYGGTCDFDLEGGSRCVCSFNCGAIRSPVCGSDGRTYGNECQLREQQCLRQIDITVMPGDMCETIDEEICDGKAPVVNPMTGREYNCETGYDTCPSNTYCHRVGDRAKCCAQDQVTIPCSETRYDCCPDGRTAALGPNHGGCPSQCNCHPLGSYGSTCDPNNNNQCTCKPGVGGVTCDRCDHGYWGLPKIALGNTGCIPCGCNVYGSDRDDCVQMTGSCVCKTGVIGDKCDQCANGYVLGPAVCSEMSRPIRSCDELGCRYGAVCIVRNSVATCDCQLTCTHDLSPVSVCGTDGRTYNSHCQLNLYSCRLQMEIQVAYEGSCSSDFSDTTMAAPIRSRKTTRHIHDDEPIEHRVTLRSNVAPTVPTAALDYGLISDYCFGDEDCIVADSFCKAGVCTCNKGYSPSADNHQCEEMTFEVPSFSGRSYLSFRKLERTNRHTSIKIRFKTLNNDGLLLYNGQRDSGHGDFIALAVRERRVEFRFDLGSGPLVLQSAQQIQLNTFHTVVARRFGQDGSLQVDGGLEVTGSSPGDLKSLNLQTALHIGFVPAMTEEIYSNVAVEVGLVGCVELLEVSHTNYTKQYNLVYPGSSDIINGKNIGECGENPCVSLPCQNEGTCLKVDSEQFRCHCARGWVGETCAINEGSSACVPNPCLSGGTCLPLPDANFACLCPTGRSGDTCADGQTTDISVPEFHENSFLELQLPGSVGESLTFEVWFMAKRPTGVILYSSQEGTNRGDFISLSLQDRYLQFRYDLGGGTANITSSRKVPLNVWHRVNIARNNRQGSLIVNGGIPVKGQSPGNLNELNLGDKLYVGGHPREYNMNAGVSKGLTGAVQKVFQNGQLLDDLITRASRLIGLTQYDGAPCPLDDNPCKNDGLCIPQLNEYECKCTNKFTGKHCDQDMHTADLELPIRFDGHTYHKYFNMIDQKEKGQRTNKFTIRFRTTSSSGLLLLLHKSSTVEGDYLAIAMTNGRTECSFNLGKQNSEVGLLILSSMERVDDGQWHTLVFQRDKRKGMLSVDNSAAVVAVSADGVSQLDTNGWLWIGGAHRVPSGLPHTYHEGFTGCISTVTVGDQTLDLVQDKQSHGSVEFCAN